ncbi:MAG: DUF4331 domain-containing protein [Rubrobacter sp.]
MRQLTPRASAWQLVLMMTAGAIAVVLVAGIFGSARPADASSHREAPFISGDPEADATDVYAFRSPDKPSTVTLIANYVPLEVPAGGPNFYKFGDEVLYEFNIDNDGDASDDLTFQFRFDTSVRNGDTFLYNTGPITSLNDRDLNQRQSYSVSLIQGDVNAPGRGGGEVLARNLEVAPANVGPASYPDGYRKVAGQARHDIGDGMRVFAGPRDEPFFVDLGGTFDLLQLRKLQGLRPKDDLAKLNVHSIALQVPITMLEGPNDRIIGVRSTSYRQQTSVLQETGTPGQDFPDPRTETGKQVQLSRLDMPLVNEVVIPLKDKDRWNNSEPENDGQFLDYVTDPELGRLIEAIYGIDVPDPPRNDLVAIFLTGIDGLNQPENVTPSSQLRLNMGIKPSEKPSRLGLLGGDNAGFPNGRRPADDVVDIELRAVAGATPFTPEFNDRQHRLGDGVNANDVPFTRGFPYLNAPHDYAQATYGGNDSSNKQGSGEEASNGGVLQSALHAIASILPG